MRPNPRWQQQGGRGQGADLPLHDSPSVFDIATLYCKHFVCDKVLYYISLFLSLLLSLSGGFQGIPSSLRQPGPRANLRHMTPNSGAQGPRGMFSVNSWFCIL